MGRYKKILEGIVVFIVAGLTFVSCDGPTVSGKIGSAELIYQVETTVMPRANLYDVSTDGTMYIVKGRDETLGERQLWYIEPPDDPVLIASDSEWWWGYPKISPDKTNVVFEDFDGIYVIPVAGGEPRLIYPKVIDAQPFQWLDNETVLINSLEDTWHVRTVNINTGVSDDILSVYGDLTTAYMSPNQEFLGISLSGTLRLYDMDTMGFKEYYGNPLCLGWSPDGTKIRFYDEYMDFETGEFIPYYEPNENPELSLYYASWGTDSKHVIAGEQHYYNIYNYDYFRIYAVPIE